MRLSSPPLEAAQISDFYDSRDDACEDAVATDLQRQPVNQPLGHHALRLQIGTPDSPRSMAVPIHVSGNHRPGDWTRDWPEDEALICVSGMLRDSQNYFNIAREAAQKAGKLSTTKLLTPSLLATVDANSGPFTSLVNGHQDFRKRDGTPNIPLYGVSGWKSGAPALNPELREMAADLSLLHRLSSFAIFDTLLEIVAENENIQMVTFLGNSASAQAFGRWAIVRGETDATRELAARGTMIRFVLSNAATYVYLDDQRPSQLLEQIEPAKRIGINDWRYGLEKPVPYVSFLWQTVEELLAYRRNVGLPVTYLAGAADAGQTVGVETHPAAAAQGKGRVSRLMHNIEQLQRNGFSEAEGVRSALVVDVAHSAADIFNSPIGQTAIFDPHASLNLPSAARGYQTA